MLMRQPGASRRIAEAHESSVEPVVITSSTSRTCRPASRSGRHTAKASSTLPARSRRGLRAWLAVLRTRRTLRRSTSTPNCAAIPSELIEIGEFRITPQSIGIIIISLAIITGLHFFFTKVKIGKCMQLANSDPEGAAMMGVNVTYMRFLTFGISAALACIAGVMIAPLTYARVDMSATIGMKAFAAAILGGIGNLWGALLGGIILGIVEAVGSAYISTAYRDAFSFIILFIVLFVKPTGLLNKKIENKL